MKYYTFAVISLFDVGPQTSSITRSLYNIDGHDRLHYNMYLTYIHGVFKEGGGASGQVGNFPWWHLFWGQQILVPRSFF